MPILIDKEPDQAWIVSHLADECHSPPDEVARLYEHEMAALAVDARVTKFVHIFAIRNVIKTLHPHVNHQLAAKPEGATALGTVRSLAS